jgi:hypothetical protein
VLESVGRGLVELNLVTLVVVVRVTCGFVTRMYSVRVGFAVATQEKLENAAYMYP